MIISEPSIIEFTAGNSFNALTLANVKNDIKPKFTPCFSLNFSLYFFLKSKIADISTSLKVVSIAVSFLTDTSLSATFLLNIESFFLDSDLFESSTLPIAGLPNNTSCFVILPDLPVPFILDMSIFFSSAIFLAAGLNISDFESSESVLGLTSRFFSEISETVGFSLEIPSASVSI